MTLQRTLRTALLWTALVAIAAYAVAAEAPLVAIAALPAAFGCWWAAGQPWAPTVPRMFINGVLLLAVGLGLGLATLGGGFNVERVAEMLTALLVVKLFDNRSSRDSAEVLALAVFLAFGAILTSLQLLVGLLLLVFCPLLVWTALLQQVVAAEERAERYQRGLGAERRRRDRGGAGISRGLRRMTGWLTVSASLVAAAVFVLVPRGLAPGFLDVAGDAGGRRTGFSEEVRLGRAGLISESQEIVLDLRVTDGSEGNLGSPNRVYHLRGAVLDAYEDGRWTRDDDRGEGRTRSIQRVQTTGPDNQVGWPQNMPAALVVQEYKLRSEPRKSDLVYSILEPISWRFSERLYLQQDNARHTMRFDENANTLTYRVDSGLLGSRRPDRIATDGAWWRGVDFPSERVRTLTNEILAADGLPTGRRPRTIPEVTAAANAIRQHLLGFSYTLDIQRAEGEPIEWFLFEGQQGHCEYFASAMAAMCRSVGINARVVTGYVAVEFSQGSGWYTVRESNAHAWVEVEHAQHQWRTHDPTPPDDFERIHQPDLDLAGMVRRWIDAIEFFWVDSVVSFDRGSQRRVLGASNDEEPQLAPLRSISDFLQRVRGSGWVGVVQAALAGVIAFCGVIGMAIAAQAFLRRTGVGVARRPRVRALGGAGTLAADLLRALERAGHPKPAWTPMLAHARGIDGGSDSPADGDYPGPRSLVGIVERLYEAHFGGRQIDANEARDLRTSIAEAGGRLRQAARAEPDEPVRS
ncbi:MAG: DUF3488 and transglutaminase-like domain-containing protein [Planctomycetota bacterium]